MKPHWGQRLGNIIAIVTLLTAAGAVYALRFRQAPARPAEIVLAPRTYCLGVVSRTKPTAPPSDPTAEIVRRYSADRHAVAPFSRCGAMIGGRVTAASGSTLLLVDSAGELAPLSTR